MYDDNRNAFENTHGSNRAWCDATGDHMDPIGYPQEILYGTLAIGLFLPLISLKWSIRFTFALLLLSDATSYTFTRSDLFGEYLNLSDIGFALLAYNCVATSGKDRPLDRLPSEAILLALTVAYGALVLILVGNVEYEVLRCWKYSIALPLTIMGGYYLIRTARDREWFLLFYIVAIGIQSLRHIDYFYFSDSDVQMTLEAKRTLRYVNCAMFVIPGMLFFFWSQLSRQTKCAIVAAFPLALLSCILTQTRSLFYVQVIAFFIAVGLIWHTGAMRFPTRAMLTISAMIIGAFTMDSTGVKVFSLFDFESFFSQGRLGSFSDSSGRIEAVELEVSHWAASPWTVVAGGGLAFHAQNSVFPTGSMREIAFWHVGMVSYLTNLGPIGAFVMIYCCHIKSLRSPMSLIRLQSFECRPFYVMALCQSVFMLLLCCISGNVLWAYLYSPFFLLFGASLRAEKESKRHV